MPANLLHSTLQPDRTFFNMYSHTYSIGLQWPWLELPTVSRRQTRECPLSIQTTRQPLGRGPRPDRTSLYARRPSEPQILQFAPSTSQQAISIHQQCK